MNYTIMHGVKVAGERVAVVQLVARIAYARCVTLGETHSSALMGAVRYRIDLGLSFAEQVAAGREMLAYITSGGLPCGPKIESHDATMTAPSVDRKSARANRTEPNTSHPGFGEGRTG